MNRIFFITEAVLLSALITLATLWIRNPDGPFEPWTALCAALLTVIEVTRRVARLPRPPKKVRALPTFEIGECTEGHPSKMVCTGEIIRGIKAAARVVEEIELYTKPSDKVRFDVRVTGIQRIRDYLEAMGEPIGSAIEERHQLKMALLDWENHLETFRAGVEIVLWNPVFRKSSRVFGAKDAAEVICGLSRHCFSYDWGSISWWLWYEKEEKTRNTFHVIEKVKDLVESRYSEDYDWIGEKLPQYRAISFELFSPEELHKHVLPRILIYIAEQRIRGISQVELNEYSDVSRWQWSVMDPNKFVKWG